MLLNDRYQLGAQLDYGTLGEMFQATDTHTGQPVVMRVLDRYPPIESQAMPAFSRDSAILRELHIPTLAPYLDAFTHEGSLYLVRPYLPGEPLSSFLEKRGPLDPRTFQQWAASLVRTLEAAHQEGIVHGDVRPSNIFVVPREVAQQNAPAPGTGIVEPQHRADMVSDYRLVITDFGLYRLVEGLRLSNTTIRLSVSKFTSPQRWQGSSPAIDDDIWSLGVMLFQMLDGELPFEGESAAAVMQKVLYSQTPNLRQRIQAPRGLIAIIERCLEKDPWRRYRSLAAVLTDLERGGVRWPGRRNGLMPREQNPWVSWGFFLLLLVLLLGIPAGGGAAFVASNQPTLTPIEIAAVVVSPTYTPTQTPVVVPYNEPTISSLLASPTPTATWTPRVITNTPTQTFTPTNTPTITPTASITPSVTPLPSATPTDTATASPPPSNTPTFTPPPSNTPPPSSTPTATATVPPTATPTPTATFTPTATPTYTPNVTVTLEYEAVLTQAAVLAATQRALETRLAPTGTPNLTATTDFQGTLVPTLVAQRVPRTEASAIALCGAGERFITFGDFRDLLLLPDAVPAGFVSEFFNGDPALHLTQTDAWAVQIPPGYARARFDLFVPSVIPGGAPPLTVSFAAGRIDAAWTGWQMTWTVTDDPATTGVQIRWVRGGVPVGASQLLVVPVNAWVTLELALQPFTAIQNLVTLRLLGPDGGTVSMDVPTLSLTPFNTVVFGGTVDSGPWLDNVLVCHQPNPLYATPTPAE